MAPDANSPADSPDVNYRGSPSATPLVEATALEQESPEALEEIFAGQQPGHLYSRLSNPTLSALEQKLAELESAVGAAVTASGMAAIAGLLLVLTRPGDKLVASKQLFGGTYSLFRELLADHEVETELVSPTDPEAFARAIDGRTRLLFVETISNPGLRVADLEELGRVAKNHSTPLVVDSTVTTPLLVQPGQYGAALVVHSTTKFLNGHGDALGGCVVDTGQFDWSEVDYLAEDYERAGDLAFLAAFRHRAVRTMGMCQSPTDARSTLKGIESLRPRLEAQTENALKLAKTVKNSPAVKTVTYPGLSEHPDHKLAGEQFSEQYGGILTLRLGSKKRCFKFLNELNIIKNMVNIGDTTSMAIHPASTICRDLEATSKQRIGVTEDLVRICVGLEAYDRLERDVMEALDKL